MIIGVYNVFKLDLFSFFFLNLLIDSFFQIKLKTTAPYYFHNKKLRDKAVKFIRKLSVSSSDNHHYRGFVYYIIFCDFENFSIDILLCFF